MNGLELSSFSEKNDELEIIMNLLGDCGIDWNCGFVNTWKRNGRFAYKEYSISIPIEWGDKLLTILSPLLVKTMYNDVSLDDNDINCHLQLFYDDDEGGSYFGIIDLVFKKRIAKQMISHLEKQAMKYRQTSNMVDYVDIRLSSLKEDIQKYRYILP